MTPPAVVVQTDAPPATWKLPYPTEPGGTLLPAPFRPLIAPLIWSPPLPLCLICAAVTGPLKPDVSTYRSELPESFQPLAGMWKHWVCESSFRFSVAPAKRGSPMNELKVCGNDFAL